MSGIAPSPQATSSADTLSRITDPQPHTTNTTYSETSANLTKSSWAAVAHNGHRYCNVSGKNSETSQSAPKISQLTAEVHQSNPKTDQWEVEPAVPQPAAKPLAGACPMYNPKPQLRLCRYCGYVQSSQFASCIKRQCGKALPVAESSVGVRV